MEGSSICFSSCEYSSSSVDNRSLLMPCLSLVARTGNTRTAPDPGIPGWAPSRQLLLLGGGDLRVLRLELGDPARGVQHALLARVERVAGAAGLDADLGTLGGAAGRERAAAGADDLGRGVLRVDTALHDYSVPLDDVVAGSPSAPNHPARADDSSVNRNHYWPMDQSAMSQAPIRNQEALLGPWSIT